MRSTDLRLKVCGMRFRENILEVAALSPDYLGFIFYPGSRRYVGKDFTIPEGISESVKKVGVFVNEDPSSVQEKIEKYSLNLVQLHGDEPVDDCKKFKEKGVEVIKAISIGDEFPAESLDQYSGIVNFFLFDTKGRERGGNGIAFDWNLLSQYNCDTPFFLSGGVSVENISNLTAISHPSFYGVDINSRVEITEAIKDVRLIRQIQKNIENSKLQS